MKEPLLIKKILVALGARPDCRLFRNATATAWVGPYSRRADGSLVMHEPRTIQAGLVKGSADIIGIGPGGRFVAIEVKTGKGQLRPEQKNFLQMVGNQGGIAGVARSVADAVRIIEEDPDG